MSLLGTYLTLSINGAVIAETTSVSMKMQSKAIDRTSHDSGLYAEFEGGKVDIAMAGRYLMATSGANWDVLWTAFNAGIVVDVILMQNGLSLLEGSAVIAKLRLSGGNSDKAVTGGYGLRYRPTEAVPETTTIVTEDLYSFVTEDDVLIIEE